MVIRQMHRRTAGSPVVVRDYHTVDICFSHTGKLTEHNRNFRRGHVLGFPSERVAQPVQEEPASFGIPSKCIPCPIVEITLLEQVPDKLLLSCLFRPPVTLEGTLARQ